MLLQEPSATRGWSKNQLRNSKYAPALAQLLAEIEASDTKYDQRYQLVIEAMAVANYMSLQVGVRFDPNEPEWPVFFIELPTGQVSWHMPQHTEKWDGHSTEEKYSRCREYTKDVR